MMRRWTVLASLALVAFAAPACDSDGGDGDGAGTLEVSLWGEDFIESGIPADEVADGWAITFDRFLISVGDLAAATDGDAAPAFVDGTYRVYDLTKTDGPALVTAATVPAGAYAHFDYTIAPAQDAVAGNATADDVALLRDGGYAVWVEGSATDGTDTVSFAWGYTEATAYVGCESTAVVPDGGAGVTQMTIHGDHFFYDDLADAEPSLRFATLAAADADGDGAVTREELGAVAGVDFAALDNYGVGDTGVTDLDAYLVHLVGTLGHIDGEGHCGE